MFERRERVRDVLRSLIRLAIILVVLVLIRAILLRLPGINNALISEIPITISMVVNVLIGASMIFIILKFEREIDHPMKSILESSLETRSLITNSIYLTAIGLAYILFYPLVDGIVPTFMWAYPLVLLLVASIPILRVAKAFYRSVDKWTETISKRLIKPKLGPEERPGTCPSCGSSLAPDASYCTNCGAKVK